MWAAPNTRGKVAIHWANLSFCNSVWIFPNGRALKYLAVLDEIHGSNISCVQTQDLVFQPSKMVWLAATLDKNWEDIWWCFMGYFFFQHGQKVWWMKFCQCMATLMLAIHSSMSSAQTADWRKLTQCHYEHKWRVSWGIAAVYMYCHRSKYQTGAGASLLAASDQKNIFHLMEGCWLKRSRQPHQQRGQNYQYMTSWRLQLYQAWQQNSI